MLFSKTPRTPFRLECEVSGASVAITIVVNPLLLTRLMELTGKSELETRRYMLDCSNISPRQWNARVVGQALPPSHVVAFFNSEVEAQNYAVLARQATK